MAVIQPQLSLATIDTIDTALGLNPGSMLAVTGTGNVVINGVGANLTTTNYAYITKQLSLTQGSYTFYWAYAAQDYLPFTDGVFFSIAGNGLNTVDLLARNGAAGITAGSTGYPTNTVILQSYGSTTFIAQTFTIASDGTYQLGFGDFNAIDTALDPILFVASKLGTTTGTVVITNPPAPPAIPDIDTAVSYYSSTDLANNAVHPVFAGGTLKIVSGGTIGNNFTVQPLGGAIDTDGYSVALTGTLSGSGSLVKRGAGTLQLMANNSGFSGDLYVNGGTLALGDTGAAGTGVIHAVDPTIAFAAGGTYANNVSLDVASPASADPTVFQNTSGNVVTLSGAITTGTGNNINGDAIAANQHVTFSGGAFTLTNGGNNWTGDTTITSDAALALSDGASIAHSARLVDNGIFDISAATGESSVASLAGSGVVTLGDNTLTITHANDTFAGTIAGAGGLVLGAGAQTLSGANSYTGGTVVGDGTLALAGDGTLGDTSGTTTVIGDGTLDLGGTSQTQNGGLTLAGGTIQNGTLASSATFALQGGAVIAALAGTGSVNQSSGTTTLSGANSYTGGTIVNGGTLALTGNGTLGDASGSATINADGTLDLGGTSQTQNGGVTLAGGTIQNGTLSSSGTFALQGGAVNATLAGTGSVNQSSGTTTLSGANSYTGGTIVNGGTLALTGNGTLGDASGSATVNADGTLDLGGTSQTQNGDVTLAGGTIQNGTLTSSGTFALQGGTVGAALAGTGSVNQASGITTLSGANSYTGGTVVNGGTLALAGDGTLGDAGGSTTVNADGTLDLGATSQSQNGGVTLVGGTIQNGVLSSSSTFALQGGTVSAALAGTGSVHQYSGTTTLSGANSYTGGTVVSGGTLALAGSGAIASSSLTVDGTFDISGIADQGTSVVDLEGSGSVVLGSKALTVSAGTGTFSGVLSGAGQFSLSGGTLTLTGANSYSGGTTITGGTLKGTSISLQGPILNDGALEFVQTADGTYAGSITGTGTLAKSGSGSLVLSGTSAIQDATTVSAGRLAVNGTLATGGLTVTNGAVLSGSGTISMAGNGILAIANGATLAPGNSPGTLTVNGSVTLASGATMAVDIDGATWSAAGGAGSYDRLAVNGTVTLGGTVVPTLRGITGSATNSYTPALGSRTTIVSATAVKGTFDTVVQPASGLAANTRFDALYTDTTAQLVVTPVSFGTLGTNSGWNSNTLAAASALDNLRGDTANSSLFNALYGLDAAGYKRAFSQISGQIYADALQGYASAANTALGTVRDQLNQGGYVGARGEQGVLLWTRYINSHEAPGDSARGNRNSATTRGFIAGATLVNTPRLRFGVAGGYTYTKINTGLGAEASGAGVVGYLYGRYAPAAFVDLSAIGGFTSGTINTSRTIATARDTVRASGNARVTVAQLAVDARLRAVKAGGFVAYALAGVQLGNASSGQVSETASDSALALTLPHSGWNTLDSRIGGQFVLTFQSIRLSAYGTWLAQLADAPTASRKAVLNGAAWRVQSTGLARNGVSYGAAASANLARNLSIQASYDGVDRGKGYHNHRVSAGVSFAF
ncbi:S-layer family protein [Novosphingobium sp. EMRT-2]|uniref:beta strand repeat-containing protein n=1 Tax=Novosphingobium sp. EMRT-2 TaxID=2571749 RepID=UPI00143DA3E7|nr:autotransporter-associated beta strand repeat-containing protein [Novosphingobium sp. EMRT-2]